jgi:hypothetical protein
LHEKVIVLEESQDEQVQYDIGSGDTLGASPDGLFVQVTPVSRMRNPYAARPTAHDGNRHQDQETPVPPAVKDVGCRHYKKILQQQVAVENKPVAQKYHRQKNSKINRIKNHVCMFNVKLLLWM